VELTGKPQVSTTGEDSRAREVGMSLRQRALSGGAILVLRQAIGTLLGLAGVLLVTRVIGPAKYGVYAAAIGIVMFLGAMATWGIDVFLLRKPSEPT